MARYPQLGESTWGDNLSEWYDDDEELDEWAALFSEATLAETSLFPLEQPEQAGPSSNHGTGAEHIGPESSRKRCSFALSSFEAHLS